MRKSLLVDATYAPSGSDRFGTRTRDDVAREGLDSFSEMVTLFVLTTFSVEPEAARGRIGEVRGRGLMVATEFARGGEPDEAAAKQLALLNEQIEAVEELLGLLGQDSGPVRGQR